MQKHSILLVDDDALIINTLSKRFATRDVDFHAVKTPEEAKAVLDKLVPEVLILDLLLTTEDGSQAILDKLKSEERLANVPVLVLTNLDKPELKQMLLTQGVKEYIIKGSLSLDELYDKVLGYLEPRK
ncbi:MAG: response regulator [Candidatus Doudnabacteria bacterium]|nr:response regulator [Candidatus Doudnabacteria bacterium]